MSIINQLNVLLLPYAYVLSPTIREAIGLDLKNAILVFDEGHNIENAAE